ncbi:hypothetical protein ACH4UM_37980 [Streptomyces sp. NPDC020801]|uniref:hypothetical protein n=1 Tax=Streptomyces sp. NPDC020801 TaxID=3365093 RepID=UPI0037ADD2BA
MAQQHRDCPPNDCKTCRRTLSARIELAAENPAVVPTTAAVMERSGLGRRAVQIHTAHLALYGMVKDGIPTGVPLDPPLPQAPEEPPTPLMWASAVALPESCRTCRCILCELAKIARGDWAGQISMRSLAERLELSEWTVRMHLRTGHTVDKIGHSLVAAGVVTFDAVGEMTGRDRNGKPLIVRRPDRFVLAPDQTRLGVYRMPYSGDGFKDGLMERLRDQTEWFDPSHKEAGWIVNLMASLIRSGWPEELLMEKLRERPHRGDRELKLPYRYARVRLPKKGTPYVRSQFAVPNSGFDKPRCDRCRVRMGGRTPDGLCPECRHDQALMGGVTGTVSAAYASAAPAITR